MTARTVEAVVFDWGGTLTPWHEVDLPEQWRVFAREVHGIPVDSPDVPQEDLDEAHRLADRILAVESAAWRRGREEHSSAALVDILDAAGVDAEACSDSSHMHICARFAPTATVPPHTPTGLFSSPCVPLLAHHTSTQPF